jgi:tetratricopeptide (TPR) repeat protein
MKKNLVFAAFFAASFVYAQDASTYIKKAADKEKEKKFEEAITLYSKAIKLAPDSLNYYLSRSYAYLLTGKVDESFQDISTVISKNPKYARAYFDRGLFYYTVKMADKSILDYTEAYSLSIEDAFRVGCLVNRSSAKLMKRDFAGCISDCKLLLQKDSLQVGALNNYAMALAETGRGEETIGILKKIIRIDSAAGYAYMNIGFQLTNMEQYKESIWYFDKTLELMTDDAYTYNNRGYAKFKLNDFDGALDDINKSLKLNSANSYAYRNRGLVYLAQGKQKKACEDWNIAMSKGFTSMYGKEVEELLKKNCN